MFLGTGLEGAPRHVYASCGFEAYTEDGGCGMRIVLDGEGDTFLGRYYRDPGAIDVTELRIEDMARFEALMSSPLGVVKSYSERVFGSQPYEGHFLKLWERTEADTSVCRVLRSGDGRVFGAAWTSPADREGFRVLDWVVHLSVADHAEETVRSVLALDGGAAWVGYAAPENAGRASCLSALGFQRNGAFKGTAEVDGRSIPLDAWTSRFGNRPETAV